MSKKFGVLFAVIITGCLGWYAGHATSASPEELANLKEKAKTESVIEENEETTTPSIAVKEGTHEYCVLQQFNSMCHIAPIYNFLVLNTILLPAFEKEEESTVSKSKDVSPKEKTVATKATTVSLKQWQERVAWNKWLSQREWFGYSHRYLEAWHGAFAHVNITNEEDPNAVPALRKYLMDAVAEGPVTPHYYNSEGKFYFAPSGSFSRLYFGQDIKAIAKFTCTPYLLIHTTAKELKYVDDFGMPALGLKVPIAREDKSSDYLMYDITTNAWNPVFTEQDNNAANSKLATIQPTYGNKSTTLTLAEWKNPALGFSAFAYDTKLGRGFFTKIDQWGYGDYNFEYAPYMAGLYKLILLNLGIDENNENIDEKAPLHGVYQDLQKIKTTNPEFNLWNEQYFKKEDFLQYHIAQILKNDKKLFEQAKATVDFSDIKYWQAYTDFLNATETNKHKAHIFRDEEGKKPYVYQDVIKYLPGPEQMMASIITTHIRLLWYGTLSEKAFYKATTGEEIGLSKWLFAGGTWRFGKDYRDKALEATEPASDKSGKKQSFMDTWHTVVEALNIKFKNKQHWISFDEHGMVLSFDQRLMKLQTDAIQLARVEDYQEKTDFLNNQLKCACIESWHGSLLPVFYKRKRNMTAWTPHQKARIVLGNQTTLLLTAKRLETTLNMLEPLKESSKKIAELIKAYQKEERIDIEQLKKDISSKKLLDKKTIQKLEKLNKLTDKLPSQAYLNAWQTYQELERQYKQIQQGAQNVSTEQQKRIKTAEEESNLTGYLDYFKGSFKDFEQGKDYLQNYYDSHLNEIKKGLEAIQKILHETITTTSSSSSTSSSSTSSATTNTSQTESAKTTNEVEKT